MQMMMMSMNMTMTMMTLMQTVEETFKFLLMDPSHLPLQISKLFKLWKKNRNLKSWISLICRCEAVKYCKVMQPQEDDEDSNGQHQDHDDSDDYNDNTNMDCQKEVSTNIKPTFSMLFCFKVTIQTFWRKWKYFSWAFPVQLAIGFDLMDDTG